MKNSAPLCCVLLLLLVSQSCMDPVETRNPKPSIAFTLPRGYEAFTDPATAKVVITVESSSGEPVMELQETGFEETASGFATLPLDLPAGDYTITDFMIVNGDDEIVYAVPKGSGPLGDSVSHPLDFSFKVMPAGVVQDGDLGLLGAHNRRAGDFGYISFRKPGHRLNIVVSADGNSRPTTANAFVMLERDTVSRHRLAAKTNRLYVPSELSEEHRLVISRSGYAPVTYGLRELVETQQNKPLTVALSAAFTLVGYLDPDVSPIFDFYLGGPEGTNITVDWGDGTTESFGLVPDQTNLTHLYAGTGNYAITITGDIGRISSFYSFYGLAMIDEAGFQHLTDLAEIRFGLTRSPEVLDLSGNGKLEFALLTGMQNLEALRLPENHRLRGLFMEGPNRISTAALDAVIDNLHRNAVAHNTRGGDLGIAASWAQEEGDESLLGPPSAATMEKIRALKQQYGWSVSPDPFD